MVSREVDAWFRNMVVQNRASRAKLTNPPDDFMQLLLNATSKMDTNDTELAGHALSLFIEGFETSSTVLCFALYELARNPEVQERAHAEIVDVLAQYDNEWSFDALQDLTYLDRVLQGYKCIKIDIRQQNVTKEVNVNFSNRIAAFESCTLDYATNLHN